jgi:glycerol-3-phosphate cytidylyltransferase
VTAAGPAAPAVRRTALVGYTAGVFDLFHIGHLRLLERARAQCDHLLVGVTTDELALQVNGTVPVIGFVERLAVVQALRVVDEVLPQTSMDKVLAWQTLHFDRLFVGEDHRGTPTWLALEEGLSPMGVQILYLPATYTRSGALLARGLDDVLDQ